MTIKNNIKTSLIDLPIVLVHLSDISLAIFTVNHYIASFQELQQMTHLMKKYFFYGFWVTVKYVIQYNVEFEPSIRSVNILVYRKC